MKRLLAVLFLLAIFVACSDNEENPIISPIENLKLPTTETAFTTGESVTIEGKGFNLNSQIWLRTVKTKAASEEDDVQMEIKEVNEHSITFIVSENIDGLKEIILKQEGKEYTLGKLTFKTVEKKEGKLYAYKRINGNEHIYQIVTIDINNGKEEIIASSLPISSSYYENWVYNPLTKEILGLDNNKLLKVNIETGKSGITNLKTEDYIDYQGLVMDDSHKLYAYKRIYETENSVYQIVNIDINNGEEIVIASSLPILRFYYEYLVYNPLTKEIIGLADNKLLKVNIETGKCNYIDPNIEDYVDYQGLVMDDSYKIYAYKRIQKPGSKKDYQIVNIDINTGQEKIVASSLPISSSYYENLVYNPLTKEIIGLDWDKLLKVNVETGKCNSIDLPIDSSTDYQNLIFIQ